MSNIAAGEIVLFYGCVCVCRCVSSLLQVCFCVVFSVNCSLFSLLFYYIPHCISNSGETGPTCYIY